MHHEGEVAEEEVHGGVQPAILADQEDHSTVPQQSEQVETQKDREEQKPPVGVVSEHRQEEFRHYRGIPARHPLSGLPVKAETPAPHKGIREEMFKPFSNPIDRSLAGCNPQGPKEWDMTE